MTIRVRIQLLTLEHCWSILAGSCLTTLLTAVISLLVMTVYLKNWVQSQYFNNIELMEDVKTWPTSQAVDFL
jgi:L-lactate permease